MLKSYMIPGIYEAGCDEAGRGCLAGPVFAAAVIMPDDYNNPELNDSKQLTPEIREVLRAEIEQKALAWAVSWVDNNMIDQINILRASVMAMHQALDKLTLRPGHVIIDGNRFYPYQKVPFTCVIRGDGTYASIAAASVLAKTWRDEYMMNLHQQIDCYSWHTNKGYPTPEHREAIQKFGLSSFHRKTFSVFDEQLEIEF